MVLLTEFMNRIPFNPLLQTVFPDVVLPPGPISTIPFPALLQNEPSMRALFPLSWSRDSPSCPFRRAVLLTRELLLEFVSKNPFSALLFAILLLRLSFVELKSRIPFCWLKFAVFPVRSFPLELLTARPFWSFLFAMLLVRVLDVALNSSIPFRILLLALFVIRSFPFELFRNIPSWLPLAEFPISELLPELPR